MSLLDEVLERRMLLYVLAAGATLAGVPSAQAKVVFTPSSEDLSPPICRFAANPSQRPGTNTLQIDLNNDGVTDFTLTSFCESTSHSSIEGVRRFLYARGSQASNLIAIRRQSLQAALNRGARVGSMGQFSANGIMAYAVSGSSGGSFLNVTGRSLGVKFLINGELHYGWIGFRTVQGFKATLAGWAYETTPNKAIIIGEPEEESFESAPLRSTELTSMELLAMGHTAVADRQRRIAVQVLS
jgi:hypothetical protein